MANNGEIKLTVKQGAVGVAGHYVTLFDRATGYTAAQTITGTGTGAGGVLGEVNFTGLDTTKDYYAIVRAPANDATGEAQIFDFLRPKAAGPTDPFWEQVQYLQDLSSAAQNTSLSFFDAKSGAQGMDAANALRFYNANFTFNGVITDDFEQALFSGKDRDANPVKSYAYLDATHYPGNNLNVNFGKGTCVEFWVELGGTVPANANAVNVFSMGESTLDASNPFYMISYGAGGLGAGTGRIIDQGIDIASYTLIPGSGYHHVAAIFDTFAGADRVTMYVDGTWVGSTLCDLTPRKLKGLAFGTSARDGGDCLGPNATMSILQFRITAGPTARYTVGGVGSTIPVPTTKHPKG